jgi:(S)-citramalyl-CoA lyase
MLPPPRSWLFTPATRPERFAKAAAAGADVLILDLEDAVASGDKQGARRAALEALASPAPILRALRMNALGTVAGVTDLAAILQSGSAPDYLVLPKVGSAAELALVAAALAESGNPTRLVGLVETAAGLLAVRDIATAPGLPRQGCWRSIRRSSARVTRPGYARKWRRPPGSASARRPRSTRTR